MNAQPKLMSADEFLDWRRGQPGRWELIHGLPVQMMAGARQVHDTIVVNIIVALQSRLRGTSCRPQTADIATRIPNGNVRQPDVTVDCGPRRDDALDSTSPTVVFEVLSPSTKAFDQVRKVDDYKRVETMRHIVLIDPERPRAVLWTRDEAGRWRDGEREGLAAALELQAIAVVLPLAEVYEGVAFERT